MKSQSPHSFPLPLQLMGFTVILGVAAFIVFPLVLPPKRSDLANSNTDISTAAPQVSAGLSTKPTASNTEPVVASQSASTRPVSTALGKNELEIVSWFAPLLNPGDDTTAFENITPTVRKLRLDMVVKYQVERFQTGLGALERLSAAADAVEERMTLLARMSGFVKDVNSGAARSLWETLSTRPAIDRRVSDESKRTFESVIDRLQRAQAEGFRQLDDPRLDARSELVALEQTLKWTKKQTSDLRDAHRDLDRVEFVVATRARELPPKVVLTPTPPAIRQTVPNFDSDKHLAMVQSVTEKLEATRKETMGSLRTLRKVNDQVQSFLAEPYYAEDPVGAAWAKVGLTSASFLGEFHLHELRVEGAADTILSDSHYTPSLVLAPVVAASEWLKKPATESPDRAFTLGFIQRSIGSAPVYMPDKANPEMVQRPDGRKATNEGIVVRQFAAWRKLFPRHSYAVTFDRPANRYNWAAQDLLEPYVSYDYWWRWATNDQWYRGSDVRLDPAKFPKDAAGTQTLWKEFRLLVDANKHLTPQSIKITLADRNARLSDINHDQLGPDLLWTYWETLFLPAGLAKEVGYRRPPIPDAATAELVDAVPGVDRFPARLVFPRLSDWYTFVPVIPRQWRLTPDIPGLR